MKPIILISFIVSLLVFQCNKPNKCDDFSPFEERYLIGTYSHSGFFLSDNYVIIDSLLRVTIHTEKDGTHYTRKGHLQYEIFGEPDCVCQYGWDDELGCLNPTSVHNGGGIITITSSNDSICLINELKFSFRSLGAYNWTYAEISGGNCFEFSLERSPYTQN